MITIQIQRRGDAAAVSVLVSAVGARGDWESNYLLRQEVQISPDTATARSAIRQVLSELLSSGGLEPPHLG